MLRPLVLTLLLTVFTAVAARADNLRVAVFRVDVTPPIGSPVAYAPARKIEDPLSSRGIVLLGAGKPIALCAVDSIGIGNAAFERWREALARAAGTSADRVAVHVLHLHDAPRHDFTVEAILDSAGLGGRHFDVAYMRESIRKTAEAAAAPPRVGARTSGRTACDHSFGGRWNTSPRAASRRTWIAPDWWPTTRCRPSGARANP